MKKIFLVSVAIATFILSGCSQKTPEVDTSADSKVATTQKPVVAKDTMSEADKLRMLLEKLNSQINSVYFDFDKFNIRSDMKSVVSTNSDILTAADASNVSVKLEGNCDEWGTDEYNYALGLKRAKAVKDTLQAQGVKSDRITIVSNGKSNPVCTQRAKSCDAQNRRVDFKLLP